MDTTKSIGEKPNKMKIYYSLQCRQKGSFSSSGRRMQEIWELFSGDGCGRREDEGLAVCGRTSTLLEKPQVPCLQILVFFLQWGR